MLLERLVVAQPTANLCASNRLYETVKIVEEYS